MMKQHILQIVILLSLTLGVSAQESTTSLVKKVAELILNENTPGIKVVESGEIVNDFTKLPNEGSLALASRYRDWYYWNGVLNKAMLELYEQFNDEKYKDYSIGNYQFIFDNYELLKDLNAQHRLREVSQLFEMGLLDHCGALAFGLTEVYPLDKREDYFDYLNQVADFMLNREQKLDDGTLARLFPHDKTVWIDDLYMSIPFIAGMGNLTGDGKYFDFAAKQIKQFNEYLYDEQLHLYFHCYYDDISEPGVAHWGRANGWAIMAQAELLDFLPEDHPERPELLRLFKRQVNGIARYQSEEGLWHQILDREDSYLETSCSAMFTYAIAKGVNEGWIEPRYKKVAIEGWKGIASVTNEKGEVDNICIGTNVSASLVDYYKRPVLLNDIHGLGAVLLAGVEVIKLEP